MDVDTSAAAIAEVISEALVLWQQVNESRQAVRMAPKVPIDTQRQLANLSAILGEVERDPALRSPAIFEQLSNVESVAAN
ncbi:hypothetical protein SLS62_010232 [Diatrype stigma]|uniref:Uncharacterized protein n=1 Tax=Diatrype stigma TaxID=117547 RepID=A0AAN9UHK3_9PEZI